MLCSPAISAWVTGDLPSQGLTALRSDSGVRLLAWPLGMETLPPG